MTDYERARDYMVKGQLLPEGVAQSNLIDSFSTTPRELFVPEKLQQIAYLDDDLFLGQGRYFLAPARLAKLLQAADVKASDVVLEIGSASGYVSAILSPLVTTIIAVENNKRQMDKAVKAWSKLELCNIALIEKSDLSKGYPEHSPYDLIVIAASVSRVPRLILEQMALQGRLVCFIREPDSHIGYAMLYYKDIEGHVSSKKLFDALVPYLDDFITKSAFSL
ncbi:MAG: protein-L-isoaspartate O-methyltransferase family protein [Alphaproteobacteria bacterium]